MAEKLYLPPGFRFKPKDEELICYYLKPKIMGQKLLCNIIKNKELYGPNCTPWELFDVNDDDSWFDCHEKPTEKIVYVFTTLSKLRSSDSDEVRSRENTSKKAGCGTWAGKTKKMIKDCKGNVIGEKRMFIFEVNEIGVHVDLSKAGYFKMHEYSLCGVNKGFDDSACVGDVVLCKITFDSSKKVTYKLGCKSTDHVSESIGEGQKKEQNNKNLVEASVGNNLEGTGNLMSKRASFELGSKSTDHVSESTGEGQKNEQNNKNLVEASVGNNLESTGNLMSKSLDVMNSGVGESIEGTECLRSENYDFGDFDDYLLNNYDCSVAAQCNDVAQFNNGFQESNDFGGDTSFDTDWFISLLTFDQEQEPEHDSTISKLGKRNHEEENLYGTKKMCL